MPTLLIHEQPETPAKTFGARIRQLREEKGFIQRHLAEQVRARLKQQDGGGFSVSYLSKIEKERESPSEAAIVQLAAVLEADLEELLTLAGKLPEEMVEKLARNRAARAFFNFAIDRLSEADWQELLAYVRNRKEPKGLSQSDS